MPHFGQICAVSGYFAPHWTQNRLPAIRAAPHFGQTSEDAAGAAGFSSAGGSSSSGAGASGAGDSGAGASGAAGAGAASGAGDSGAGATGAGAAATGGTNWAPQNVQNIAPAVRG